MDKPNILLIAIDSLLATHLSCYGYHRQTSPHIDRFAQEGTLFEQLFSPHIPTTPGYASMLTGRDCFGTNCVALRHKGPLADGVPTMPEILRAHGYHSLCVGFQGNPSSRGFDEYLGYEAWGDKSAQHLRKAEKLNDVLFPRFDELAAGEQPFFIMLRHMDPHSPYLPPPPFDGLFYQGDPCDPANDSMKPVMDFKPFRDYFATWMPAGITDKDYVIAQYDGAIAYMDSCIHQIIERLRTAGILDDTIVVITSDHGETLYDHECWFDHHGLYDVCLKVPLIIRYPERLAANQRVDGYCQLKDLLPTMLDLAGIDTDLPLDGNSLLQLAAGEAASFASSMYLTECTWMRKHGWRTPEWKLIEALEPDFHFKPEVELYNLVTDPDELHNVADEYPEVVEGLRASMQRHIAEREATSGRDNPIHHQPGWHGAKDIDYFTSSEQAYETLHIGDPTQARKLQAKDDKKAP